MLSDKFLVPKLFLSFPGAWSSSEIPSSWKIPFSTSLKATMAAPSSINVYECKKLKIQKRVP